MKESARGGYWDPAVETLPRESILKIQWERLKEHLDYLYRQSPFYRGKFRSAGFTPQDIKSLEDFRELVPLTSKDELRLVREERGDPFCGLLCVERENILYILRTAGTTGLPSIYGLTKRDIEHLGDLMARLWYQIGARMGDTVACATMGTWNFFARCLLEGLRTAGITTYHFAMPIEGEEIFPIEVLPQYMDLHGFYLSARPLMQITEKYGKSLKEMLPSLKYVMVAGQRMTDAFRRGMEDHWGCGFFEAYTMTDAGLPSATCTAQPNFFHFPEDSFLIEVIDPQTGEDLTGTQKEGEFVVTPLLLEGTPLVRFRSGDIGLSILEPCQCGRTGMRLALSERLAHSVLVGQRRIFTRQVEEVLYGLEELLFHPYYLVREKVQPQDRLILHVQGPGDKGREEPLKRELLSRLQDDLGVKTEVHFVPPESEHFIVGYKYLKVVER
jgi:phenylacetate-CoA ligase